VSGSISQAIAERGGATAVAAGSAFTAVLTASGRVLLWGNLAMHSNTASRGTTAGSGVTGVTGSDGAAGLGPQQAAAADRGDDPEADPTAAAESARCTWHEVGLPSDVRVRLIAAGQQHLLMSDGERGWAVGRWLDDAGVEAGAAPVEFPQQLLAVPGSGIVKLSAGLHSSAAVDGDGRLWMWGRMLNPAAAGAAVHAGLVLPVGGGGGGRGASAAASAAAAAAVMSAAEAARRLAAVDWGWAGFGGSAPRVVEGLQGVRDVALGGWHVLAMTD
jgi:alpha-tubulin suppressor-like RCC1 family protein